MAEGANPLVEEGGGGGGGLGFLEAVAGKMVSLAEGRWVDG